MTDSLLEQGIIILPENIEGKESKEIIEQILYVDNLAEYEGKINLLINTLGGYFYDCLAVCNMLTGAGRTTKTIVNGNAQSGAFLIAISGKERLMTKNSVMMSHNFIQGKDGGYKELVALRKHEDLMYKEMKNLILSKTKLTEKNVEEIALTETSSYYDYKECIKYGFVDEIVEEITGDLLWT